MILIVDPEISWLSLNATAYLPEPLEANITGSPAFINSPGKLFNDIQWLKPTVGKLLLEAGYAVHITDGDLRRV